MPKSRLATVFFLGAALFSAPSLLQAEDAASWPQWRGQQQNGVAGEGAFPTEWAEGEGIVWKTPLAGVGGSTPVVADGTVFLTAGVEGKNTLFAFDLETGDQKWVLEIGDDRGGKHRKGSGSNPSAVTDGERVFAYFRSGDLACSDLSGDLQWQVNLQDEFGEDTLWWDLGSSPMLIGDVVVVAVMQTGPSYLVAYDRKSGKQAWKVDRMLGAPEEAAQSYATPIALEDQGLIAVMGADHLTLHSSTDGRELGRVGGFNPEQNGFFRSISSPVASETLVVCPYSRGGTVTTCRIKDVLAGKKRDSIAWFRDDIGSDVPTPALLDGKVYLVGDGKGKAKGTVQAVDVESGKTVWSVQLPKSRISYSSSPLVAGNHLYVTGEDATTYVVGPLDAKQPELTNINRLADSEPFTVASPIPVGGRLLLRTRNALYCIGK